MPSKAYVFPVEKPESLLGIPKSKRAFLRKEIYFRFRALFSTYEEEAQRFNCIAKMIGKAKKHSSIGVDADVIVPHGRPNDLLLVIKFDFPDYGKLLGFDSLIEPLKCRQ